MKAKLGLLTVTPMSGLFRLIPYAVLKPWGGGHLDRLAGNHEVEKVGEYVLFSDLPQFPVRIATPAGQVNLHEFLRQNSMNPHGLPFMLKLLSTNDPISLQNHPSDTDAIELGLSGGGKFECWTILDSDASACAYLGLRHGEDGAVLRTLETDSAPLTHFNAIHPRRGDVIKLNPGLVHSTTGRLLFYEIQQTSDNTFRIYDFGRGRELHIEQAIHCLKDQTPDIGTISLPLITEKFSLLYHNMKSSLSLETTGRDFSVLTWFGHEAVLRYGSTVHSLTWGDSFLAAGKQSITVERAGEVLPGEETQNLPMIDVLFEAFA